MANPPEELIGDDDLLAEPPLPEFELRWESGALIATAVKNLKPKALGWDELPYNKATLLFADDNVDLVATLERGAKREGFATVSDTTSENVLKLARLHRPDVIVLDLHQRVDGRELLADLKRDPQTRDIKVVMLSGEENQVTRNECFHLGADDYFTKPLDRLFYRRLSQIAGIERGT